jgi:hypothetical protein
VAFPKNTQVLLRARPFDFHTHHHHHHHQQEPIFSNDELLSLLYSLFICTFSLLAVGSITFSSHDQEQEKPKSNTNQRNDYLENDDC